MPAFSSKWTIRTPRGDYYPRVSLFEPPLTEQERAQHRTIWFFARCQLMSLDAEALGEARNLYAALDAVAFPASLGASTQRLAECLAQRLDFAVFNETVRFAKTWACKAERPRMARGARPGEAKGEEGERKEAASEGPRFFYLSVQTASGDPVEDSEGFLLIKPNGTIERAYLSNGVFRKDDVPAGNYRARFKYLAEARWCARQIESGSEVEMHTIASGFDAGTPIVFTVYKWAQPSDTKPVAKIQTYVKDGAASATWRHEQAVGEPAGDEYVFEVASGAKWAASDILPVVPHPTSDLCGIKERLLQLGYDCGAPGPEATPELEQALRSFKESYGFLEPDGEVDEATIKAIEEVI